MRFDGLHWREHILMVRLLMADYLRVYHVIASCLLHNHNDLLYTPDLRNLALKMKNEISKLISKSAEH